MNDVMVMFKQRQQRLCEQLIRQNIGVALITDDDSIYYYSGYYDYLHMDFGRPTVLVIYADGKSALITPTMELAMAEAAAWVDYIEPWNDGMGDEWRAPLLMSISQASTVAIEAELMPAMVQQFVKQNTSAASLVDITPAIADMRMIKSDEELKIAKHAGEVAIAMMTAARNTIAVNVPEYEVALSAAQAGTRCAAQLLEQHYTDQEMSPNTHFLQIMASGKDFIKPHHRASTKRIKYASPVFMCFCGMTNFHRFKLGFDRTFWVGEIKKKSQQDVYQVAVDSQAAALEKLGPGVLAQDVHGAYAKVIQSAGYDYPFRCGRATGFSFLEKPQLVFGDKTLLKPGMVLAVDGSVTDVQNSFRAQVGDSFVITETGYQPITEFSKKLDDVIL